MVRQVVGYDRLVGEHAHRQLTELYGALCLYVNCFQPSMKLVVKHAEGRTVCREYDAAKTPLQRLLLSGVLPAPKQQELRAAAHVLDPIHLFRQVQSLQQAVFRCAANSSILDHPPAAPPLQVFSLETCTAGSLRAEESLPKITSHYAEPAGRNAGPVALPLLPRLVPVLLSTRVCGRLETIRPQKQKLLVLLSTHPQRLRENRINPPRLLRCLALLRKWSILLTRRLVIRASPSNRPSRGICNTTVESSTGPKPLPGIRQHWTSSTVSARRALCPPGQPTQRDRHTWLAHHPARDTECFRRPALGLHDCDLCALGESLLRLVGASRIAGALSL